MLSLQIPLQQYLVQCRTASTKPVYVAENEPLFEATLASHLARETFDESQRQAMECLRHQVCLVQGPPGTGKSFVGVRMARLAYTMRELVVEVCVEGVGKGLV